MAAECYHLQVVLEEPLSSSVSLVACKTLAQAIT